MVYLRRAISVSGLVICKLKIHSFPDIVGLRTRAVSDSRSQDANILVHDLELDHRRLQNPLLGESIILLDARSEREALSKRKHGFLDSVRGGLLKPINSHRFVFLHDSAKQQRQAKMKLCPRVSVRSHFLCASKNRCLLLAG